MNREENAIYCFAVFDTQRTTSSNRSPSIQFHFIKILLLSSFNYYYQRSCERPHSHRHSAAPEFFDFISNLLRHRTGSRKQNAYTKDGSERKRAHACDTNKYTFDAYTHARLSDTVREIFWARINYLSMQTRNYTQEYQLDRHRCFEDEKRGGRRCDFRRSRTYAICTCVSK